MKKPILNKEKKAIKIEIISLTLLLIMLISGTYAYYMAQKDEQGNGLINVKTGTTDVLSFSTEDIDASAGRINDFNQEEVLSIYASTDNFYEEGINIGDGVKAKANLKANDATNEAHATYNVYLKIEENGLKYTTGDQYPELILTIIKPDGTELTELAGYDYHEKDEDRVNDISGFDITEANGYIGIVDNYKIDVAATDADHEEEQNWEIKITLINLDQTQNAISGKKLKGKIIIQEEDVVSFFNVGKNDKDFYRSDDYREQIKNIRFVDYIAEDETRQEIAEWDLSSLGDNTIIGWLQNNGEEEVPYDLYIGSESIIRPKSLKKAFYNMINVETITLANIDTYNTTDMSHMFAAPNNSEMKLKEIIGINGLDTRNVTTMRSMFYNNNTLTTLDLSGWDTQNVTDMSFMFNNATSLQTIGDVSQWQTTKVTTMQSLFYNASTLTTLDLSGWNTQNVTDMRWMFYGTTSLQKIDGIESFKTTQVTTMQQMFSYASALTTLDLSGWDTQNVTDMSFMFNNATSLQTIGDVSQWQTTKVTIMNSMFSNASALTTLDLSGWDTKNVTNMSNIFLNNTNLTNLNLSGWYIFNATNLLNMINLLKTLPNLQNLNLSNWDTSSVTSFSQLFRDSKLKVLDLSNWKTSNVINMSWMFYNAKELTTLNITGWDTSNVKTMAIFLNSASSLESIDITGWDTQNVTDMSNMFDNMTKLKTIKGIENLNVTKVETMENMFLNDPNLTNLNLINWNTSSLINTARMFDGCSSLANLNLHSATFGKVNNSSRMFADVPNNIKIIVKDSAAQKFIQSALGSGVGTVTIG